MVLAGRQGLAERRERRPGRQQRRGSRKNPKAAGALNQLSAVLTTADLTALNAQVDGQRLEASQVAEDYLKEKGLI